MDRRPRELPGFYYDEAKKKYFRIQENKDVPHGSQYSQDSVAHDRHEAKKRKVERAFEHDSQKQRVCRSPLLATQPQAAAQILARELGASVTRGTLSLNRSMLLASKLKVTRVLREIERYESTRLESVGVPMCLAYDEQLDTVLVGRKFAEDQPTVLCLQKSNSFANPFSRKRDVHGHSLLRGGETDITSISVSSQRKFLITRLGEPDGNMNAFPRVQQIGEYGSDDLRHEASQASLSLNNFYAALGMGECSAANPHAITPDLRPDFAVADENTVDTLAVPGETGPDPALDWNRGVGGSMQSSSSFPSRIKSLGWLNRQTVIAGGRNGTMYLWDIRGQEDRYKVPRLHRKGPIEVVCPINQTYVALAGSGAHPGLYDLRVDRPDKPIVEYLGGQPDRPNGGFDVQPRLGLAVHSSFDGYVHLHSLWNGRPLRTFHIGERGRAHYLKFVDGPKGTAVLGCVNNVEFRLSIQGPLPPPVLP